MSHTRHVPRKTTKIRLGTLGVLRAYVAAASLPKDRSRAVALGIACFVTGLSGGPAIQVRDYGTRTNASPDIQALFGPIGHKGFEVFSIVINMYTAPAYLMIILSIISVILLYVIFEERFAGLLSEETKQGGRNYSKNTVIGQRSFQIQCPFCPNLTSSRREFASICGSYRAVLARRRKCKYIGS